MAPSACRRSRTSAPRRSRPPHPTPSGFYQVYVFRDRGVTDELIAQAVASGYSAVFLTVDLPVVGSRDRERRIHWTFPEDTIPAMRYAIERGALRPGLDMVDPTIDWAYLEHLVATAKVPVVVKGILDEEDARRRSRAVPPGSSSRTTVVGSSTDAPATIDALPGDRRGGRRARLEVLLDSGIRRGSRRRRSPGAWCQGVLAGRLPLWGLAIGGADGVHDALELLREETAVTMHLTGCATVADGRSALPRP